MLENVFFSRGEPSRVVLLPLADPSLVEGLNRRGYRLSHFENILAMPLEASDSETSSTPGIEVRPVAPDEGELYASVVAPNFVEPGEPVDQIMEMALTRWNGALRRFLALIDGEPVGGAPASFTANSPVRGPRDVLPFRNRGVHAALHHARFFGTRRLAGCDVAAQGAAPGSTSQRNAERRGLRSLTRRALFIREPA